jgi:isopentenyl-diphosphate delta-isomerase
MSQDRTLTHTYAVRELLPDTVLLGNIGAQQARELGIDGVRDLMERIEADAIAIHLNVAQELAQPEGDRNFRDFAATIAALVAGLDGRVVVKETGCGISPAVAELLARGGVRNIDISGAGGTSWVRVEELRADPAAARIAATYAGWGIPTAAATAAVRSAVGPETTLIASGGLRSGLDVAKVLALGANLAGAALPILRALADGGPAAAEAALERIATEFRHAMLLTGSSTTAQLRRCRRVVRSPLSDWVEAL